MVWRWALVATLLLAALNLGWGLGASSLFVDETISWRGGSLSYGALNDFVYDVEVTPHLYYVGLHEWIVRFGAEAEWVLRLPSAVAGVLLVAAVFWVGSCLGRTRAALGGALLAAVSPLVLEYGQQVRAYVFVMLAVVLVAGMTLRVVDSVEPRGGKWAIAAAVTGAAAIWLHYTSLLIIVPLAVWLVRQRSAAWQARAIPVAAWAAAFLAALPLLLHQSSQGHEEGLREVARLTPTNLLEVLGAPFDDRTANLTPWLVVGAAVVMGAVAVLLIQGRSDAARGERLIASLAIAAPAAVVVATVVGHNALLSRYAAVSVPFALIATALAAEKLGPRRESLVLGTAYLALLAGSVYSHREEAFYPDMRGAFEDLASEWHAGDVLLVTGYTAIPYATEYYRARLLPEAPAPLMPGSSAAAAALEARPNIWLIRDGEISDADATSALRPFGYALRSISTYPPQSGLTVVGAEAIADETH